MRYLSFCAIVKDEEESYLHEWLLYHHALGIEHFYLYDNESKVPVRNFLSEYVDQGWLNVYEIHGRGVQLHAYTHCLHNNAQISRWIGFLDLDEFIVLSTPQDLRSFLVQYEPYGALGINWLCFGSSGYIDKPGPSQLEHFIHRTPSNFPDNRHIKSIVQSKHTIAPITPHNFLYRNGYYCVNEKSKRIDGPITDNSTEKIRINHYFLRSKNQFLQKIERGRADTGLSDRPSSTFNHFEDSSTIPDSHILELWDPISQEFRNPLANTYYFQNHSFRAEPNVSHVPTNQMDLINYDVQYLINETLNSIQNNQFTDSAAILALLLNRYPGYSDGYLLLSDLLLRTGHLDQALNCLETAEQNGLSGSSLSRLQGIIHNLQCRYQEADKYLKLAQKQNPTDVDNLIQLAINALDMDQTMMAYDYLIQAQEMDPDNPEIRHGILIVNKRINSDQNHL